MWLTVRIDVLQSLNIHANECIKIRLNYVGVLSWNTMSSCRLLKLLEKVFAPRSWACTRLNVKNNILNINWKVYIKSKSNFLHNLSNYGKIIFENWNIKITKIIITCHAWNHFDYASVNSKYIMWKLHAKGILYRQDLWNNLSKIHAASTWLVRTRFLRRL